MTQRERERVCKTAGGGSTVEGANGEEGRPFLDAEGEEPQLTLTHTCESARDGGRRPERLTWQRQQGSRREGTGEVELSREGLLEPVVPAVSLSLSPRRCLSFGKKQLVTKDVLTAIII